MINSVFTLIFVAFANCQHPIIAKSDNVIDGDTIKDVIIEMDFGITTKKTIRLLGIDAPEMRGVSDNEKRKAVKSRDRLRAIVSDCPSLTLNGSSSDSFGRTLARIYCQGRDISQLLLEEGHAKEYK